MDKISLKFFRGALTSKPYAFLARPWEFKSVDSIDVFDTLGSNIRVDLRGDKILRILPRSNDFINEDWISDRIRFICDAARVQRLDSSILKYKGVFYNLTWNQVFSFLTFFFSNLAFNRLLPHFGTSFNRFFHAFLVAGAFIDLESASLLSRIRTTFFFNSKSFNLVSADFSRGWGRELFLINTSKQLTELSNYDSVVLVNCNIKLISPVLAIRLRTLSKTGLGVYSFGGCDDQSFLSGVGSMNDFYSLLGGKHWLASRLLKGKTFFLFGENLKFVDSFLIGVLQKFRLKIGFLASFVSDLALREYCVSDLAFSSNESVPLVETHTNSSASAVSDLLFNKMHRTLRLVNPLSVSLISHGGPVADSSDFLIPISSVFEQSKYYLNSVGFKQKTRLCLAAPNNVLDHSTVEFLSYSALFAGALFKLCASERLVKLFTFFSFINSFYLGGLKDKMWLYVNSFFESLELNFNLSKLISFIFLELNLVDRGVSFTFLSNFRADIFLPNRVEVTTGANRKRSSPDFYQNDEISLVSSTLVTASKRLVKRSSFN